MRTRAGLIDHVEGSRFWDNPHSSATQHVGGPWTPCWFHPFPPTGCYAHNTQSTPIFSSFFNSHSASKASPTGSKIGGQRPPPWANPQCSHRRRCCCWQHHQRCWVPNPHCAVMQSRTHVVIMHRNKYNICHGMDPAVLG